MYREAGRLERRTLALAAEIVESVLWQVYAFSGYVLITD